MAKDLAPDPLETPLAQLMRAGDIAALDQFAREFGPRLVRIATRCCRSPSDVDDAIQSAMLEASKSMQTYRGEGSPVAWLSTLVARSCYRMNAHTTPAVETDVDNTLDCTCDDPAAVLERKRLGESLGDALMALPRSDRLMFVLASQGWTGPELAAQFGTTSDAIRSRLKRSRRTLQQALPQNHG